MGTRLGAERDLRRVDGEEVARAVLRAAGDAERAGAVEAPGEQEPLGVGERQRSRERERDLEPVSRLAVDGDTEGASGRVRRAGVAGAGEPDRARGGEALAPLRGQRRHEERRGLGAAPPRDHRRRLRAALAGDERAAADGAGGRVADGDVRVGRDVPLLSVGERGRHRDRNLLARRQREPAGGAEAQLDRRGHGVGGRRVRRMPGAVLLARVDGNLCGGRVLAGRRQDGDE